MRTLYLECNMGTAGDILMSALAELLPDPDGFHPQNERSGSSRRSCGTAEDK